MRTAQQIIQQDPELLDLAHQLAAIEYRSGETIAWEPNRSPETWVKAIRAAAACFIGEA